MKLRPYQSTALDELWKWFSAHPEGNPIVEAVVGAGKSVLIAALAQRAMSEYPGTRILVIVHQKELLQQNLEKLLAVWPDAPVGVHSASVGKKDLGHDIIYATIGSIHKKAHLLGRCDLVLCDECHLINPKEAGMWRGLIADLQKYNPATRVIGWSGTAFRGDGVWLTAGDTPLFHGIACRVTMGDLLGLGFLAPLTTMPVTTQIDASGVAIQNGDYNIQQLAQIADVDSVVESACDEIVTLAASRKRWLVFCVTVEHAHHVSEALQRRGIECAVVSAKTPKAERETLIADFRSGRLRCLVNVAVLTTGFDVPEVDCIAMLRNTKSPVLYVQIGGRGMRVVGANIEESRRNGKADCLWLDFTDTTSRLGPIDKIKGRGPKASNSSAAPMKVCDNCGSVAPISARECPDCGALFPIEDKDPHGNRASASAIISTELMAVTYTIRQVTYNIHQKPGKPESLQVSYWQGMRIVCKEWVCFEHGGFARVKAENWWKRREPREMKIIPASAQQAYDWIAGGYAVKQPIKIVVNESNRYPEIIAYEWNEQASTGGSHAPHGEGVSLPSSAIPEANLPQLRQQGI